MFPIRVLLVDDSPAFARASKYFFASLDNVNVVGRASCGEQAVELVTALAPDLIVMDLAMPGMGGLAATQQIKQSASAPKVLILTLHNGSIYRQGAHRAGADGFLAKDDLVSQLPAFLAATFPAGGQGRPDGLGAG